MRRGKLKRPAFAAAASGVTLTLTLALVACAGGGDGNGAGESPEPADLEGQTIRVLVSSGHQQFNPVWDRLGEFEQETGITVELDEVGTVDIEGTFLRDVTAGGCTYDAVEMLDGALPGAAQHMADLGAFLDRDGSSPEELLSRHVGWAEGAMTYDDQLKYHPYYSGSKAIAYRQDLFANPDNQAAFEERYGYPLPVPPETPEQIVDVAEFFTGNGTEYGIVFSGQGDSAETTVADLIFRHGVVGYQDEQGNALWGPEHTENQEIVADAATWITDFVRKGHAPSEVTAMATGEATSFYTDGRAAMIYDHIYLPWAQFNAENVTSRIGPSGSFEPPNFAEDGSGIVFFWGYGIPECADAQDAGWEFITWLMTEENLQLALSEGEGVFVPTDLEPLEWATAENLIPEGVAQTVENSQPYRITTATGRIRQAVNIPLVEQLFQGQLSPEEYARTSGQAIQEEAEASGVVD
ncbi:ABC transporter substrate-binding protein [Georgenia sp. AZ-5]|uniref:ABC transporter substrate-binding protein n=1 Tax=Georgenia sp. AZ-5 TaxID=3367526 RepID=UPI0037553336